MAKARGLKQHAHLCRAPAPSCHQLQWPQQVGNLAEPAFSVAAPPNSAMRCTGRLIERRR
eukprot:5749254-Pleurochrysis_carterae.AAC.14